MLYSFCHFVEIEPFNYVFYHHHFVRIQTYCNLTLNRCFTPPFPVHRGSSSDLQPLNSSYVLLGLYISLDISLSFFLVFHLSSDPAFVYIIYLLIMPIYFYAFHIYCSNVILHNYIDT